jgi:uncharacterized membrane protein
MLKIQKYNWLLILFTIGFIISSILTLTPIPEICDPNEGCDVVLSSDYASFLGLKNSAYGVGIFLILMFVTLIHMKKPRQKTRHLIHLSITLASGIAIYFLYIQKYVLKSFCKYCMFLDILIVIGLIFTIIHWEE